MALPNKIAAFAKKVQDLIQRPTPSANMTWQQLQVFFDSAPEELRVYVNSLIDALKETKDTDSGADNIGATPIAGVGDNSTSTVQKIMEGLKALDDSNRAYLLSQIQGVIIGQIPDGTITDVKLSDEAGQMKDKVNSHLNDIANKTDEAKGAALIGMKPITGLTGDNVRTAMQNLFQYANDGKTAVANAVTAKGVSASPTDTFSVLATKIGQINTGKRIATGSVSLSGSTATVNNLSFKPSQVIFYLVTSVSDTMYGKGCVAKGSYFEHPQLYFTNYNSAEPSTVGISNLTFSDTGFVATFNMAGSVTSFYISGYVAIE